MVFISPEPNGPTLPFLSVGNGTRLLCASLGDLACIYSRKTSRVLPEFDRVTSETRSCTTTTTTVIIVCMVNLNVLLTFLLIKLYIFHVLFYCEPGPVFNVFWYSVFSYGLLTVRSCLFSKV